MQAVRRRDLLRAGLPGTVGIAAAPFLAAAADPAGTFADRDRCTSYLPLLGNLAYDQRTQLAWKADYVL